MCALAIQVPARQRPNVTNDTVIEQGLIAWRKPGGKLNSACSSCHAPDAFDIAGFAFSDTTILRRAHAHLENPDAVKIVALVHAIRKKYNIQPLNPMRDRPLQPGGTVLEGKTSEERDLAFGKSLATTLPILMRDRVDSFEKAKKARDEVLAVDARNLKIGIPFNRWSEDIFHGSAHGVVADWIADVPCAPDPAKQQEWFQRVDHYIAEPSDENFWNVYNAVPVDTKPFSSMAFSNELSYHKYKSLLIAQHLLRKEANGNIERSSSPIEFAKLAKGVLPNPFWEVGEYAVLNEGLDSDSQGVPREVLDTFDPAMPFPNQMRAMKLPWLWIGWLSDQGLQRTPGDQNTHSGRYFTVALYTDGNYALHNCFMITRKQLVQSYIPEALPEGKEQRFVLDYSEFAAHRNLIRYEPQDPERQAMFRKMTGNAFRMSLYLLQEEVKRTGVVASRAICEFQIQAIREYLIYSDPENKKQNTTLADQTLIAVMAAKDSSSR
jgi:hypothetical protein